MNVLFIEMASDGTVGGSHTCMYNLVSNLNREKYKCSIAFYQTNSYVEKFRSIGIPVYLINRKPLLCSNVLVRKLINWYRLVYKHKIALSTLFEEAQIDLVVINNSIIGCEDIVSVATIHNIPIISYERGYLEYSKTDINLTKKLHASIAVSNAILTNMVKQEYRANTHLIYDGLPDKYQSSYSISKSVANIKYEMNIPEDSIVIGIIGNIREWKGQEYFVRAFMSLGEKYRNLYGLVIGGYGTEDIEYVDFVKSISESSEVGRRLKFLGFRDDVPNLYRIMDVFIHASIKPEPFGMVILEAMQHQIPVIATNFGGPVEILENGHCGILVPPCDVNAIIDGVEKYLNNSTFRNDMVDRAHKRVIEVFDLRRTVDMVEDLFREVITKANHA